VAGKWKGRKSKEEKGRKGGKKKGRIGKRGPHQSPGVLGGGCSRIGLCQLYVLQVIDRLARPTAFVLRPNGNVKLSAQLK